MGNNKLRTRFLGAGVFSFLTITSISYLIKVLSRDMNILLNTKPQLNFWFTEFITLLIFAITSYLLINKVQKSYETIKINKFLIVSIGAFFLVQIIQFLYTFYGTDYVISNYHQSFESYYNYLKENIYLNVYSSFMPFLKHLIFVVFIFLKK